MTDKRFEASGADHVTFDELGTLLRLGARSKTFVLLLLHFGRLRALDAKRGSKGSVGAARYCITGGAGGSGA